MVKSAARDHKTEIMYPLRGTKATDFIQWTESLEGGYGKRWKRLKNGYKMAYYRRTEVLHYKEQASGQPHIMWDYPGWGSTVYKLDCSPSRGDQLLQTFEPVLSAVEYKLLNGLYKRLKPQDLSFSLFSFLYECREMASLLDPAKVALKRLSKKKNLDLKAKAGRSKFRRGVVDDLSDTYVNANFGYVPTISDSKEIMSRYNGLKDAHSSIKKLMKEKRRYGFSENVDLGRGLPYGPFASPAVIGNANTGAIAKLTFKSAKCTVNGVASYDIPLINTMSFTTAVLDRGGIHFDLATVWNAVPFSWLVDWILPIGDALEADRKPWTEINILNDGTLSWKIEYEIVFTDDLVQSLDWAGRPPNYSEAGKVYGSIYWRYRIPPIAEYRFPPFKLFGGWSLKRAAILAAVANGFRK